MTETNEKSLLPFALFAALFLVGCHLVGPVGFWSIDPIRVLSYQSNDYFQDWASARNHFVGMPVYTPHAKSIPFYLERPRADSELMIEYNAHPPTSVLLALLLGWIAFPDAVVVWNLLSLAALFASLAIVAAALPELKPQFWPILGLLPFCLAVYGNLQQSQLNLLLLLLVTAAWALDRSGRSGAAGLLVGAAATLKLFPAYLCLYFAARRQWRAVLAAAVSFSALNLTTAAVLGWQTFDDYLYIVLPYMKVFSTLAYNMSIAGFWHKLFDPSGEAGVVIPLWPSPAIARYGTLLTDLVVTAVVGALAYRAKTPRGAELAFGAAVAAMLLVSPVVWDISMIVLMVPIALIARTAQSSGRMPVALILILTIFWLPQGPLTELAQAGRTLHAFSPAFMLGAPSLKFYALLATFALCLTAFRAEEYGTARAGQWHRRGRRGDHARERGNPISSAPRGQLSRPYY
jgi:hypothetical protein